MVEAKVTKYLNPITLEAEVFAASLKKLSKTHNIIDKNLINALDKVIQSIERFLDQKNQEIIATENRCLVEPSELKSMTTLYFCMKCNSKVGQCKKAVEHVTKQCSRVSNNKKSGASIEEIKLSRKASNFLVADYKSFIQGSLDVADKLKCIPEYDKIEAELLSTIRPSFPDIPLRIYRFGSRVSGIGCKNSDIDIFIDIGDTFRIFENRPSSSTIKKLQTVFTALSGKQKIWKGAVKIEKTRVPIVKVYHIASGLECDIGVSNSLGVINTKLMEYLFDIQPIGRVLCIFFKKWLMHVNLNADFSKYSIVLMVITFLQIKNVMPSIQFLQSKVDFNKTLYIGPWLGSFVGCSMAELQLKQVNVNASNFKKYLTDFFVHYSNFDFSTHIVCPYLGKSIKKEDITHQMPTWYTFYVENSSDDCNLNVKKPMVVQDPIQLNHNVAKGVSEKNY